MVLGGLLAALSAYACGDGNDDVGAPIGTPDAGRESGFIVGDSSGPSGEEVDAGPSPQSTIAMGGGFGCVLGADGTVACWGRNDVGQLGSDPAATPACGGFPCSPTPQKVEGLANVARLALGEDFACALDTKREVWCWGGNASGQLVTADLAPKFTPQRVIVDVKQISAAGRHACALTSTGFVRCWGENTCDMLGRTDGGLKRGAAQVPNLPQMTQVSVGIDEICATGTEGNVLCWGADHAGSLGHELDYDLPLCDGAPADVRPKSVQVDGPDLFLGGVADVHVGAGVVCARRTDGSVVCWGDNAHGALGQGVADASPHRRAIAVPALKATKVDVGGGTACAIVADRLLCWGAGSYGQLDALTTDNGCGGGGCRALGYPIKDMLPVRELSVGPGAIATIKTDLSPWVWGRNDSAELGVARTDPANVTCAGGSVCIPQPRKLAGAPPLD